MTVKTASTESLSPPNPFELMNMAWLGQALYTATALGWLDHLSESGPAFSETVAEATGCSATHTHQILRALTTHGYVCVDDTGRFEIGAAARPLLRKKGWMRQYALLWGEQLYAAAGDMMDMAKTGKTAFATAHGAPLWQHYVDSDDAGQRFLSFMTACTNWQRKEVERVFDFSRFKHVVDVGGGEASLTMSVLQTNPHLSGTILDQPHIVPRIDAQIQEAGLSDRCTAFGGDFFTQMPPDGDLYVIKHVLHDWANKDAVRILKNIHAGMPDDAPLLIVEGVLDDSDTGPLLLKTRDLEQMVWTGGRVRSEEEFRALTGQAGFAVTDVIATSIVDVSLLLCRKAGA